MSKRYLFLGLLVMLFACEDTYQEPFLVDESGYFPLFSQKLYQINEVAVERTESGNYDTVYSRSYYARDLITDTLESAGLNTYVVTRSSKNNLSDAEWSSLSTYSFKMTEKNVVERIESNDLVKLVFPVKDEFSWDRNAFNIEGGESSEYNLDAQAFHVEVPAALDSVDLIEVILADLEVPGFLTDKDYELYGKGIGLVRKESLLLEYCQEDTNPNCEAGTLLYEEYLSQTLISYE